MPLAGVVDAPYRDRRVEAVRQAPQVLDVARDRRRPVSGTGEDYVRVHDIGSAGPPEQGADVVGLGRPEARDLAAAQEATSWTWRGGREARATTGAVVSGTTPASRRARWSAHTARSLRSAATSRPVS